MTDESQQEKPKIKLKKNKFKQLYTEYDRILQKEGKSMKYFLQVYRKKVKNKKHYRDSVRFKTVGEKNKRLWERRRKFIKSTLKLMMKYNSYALFVNPQIAARFRIVCIAEKINPKLLIEGFMTAFVEGDEAIFDLMKNINKYHQKLILNKSKQFSLEKRFARIDRIMKFYNIPIEWYKKYADLKIDDVEI